MAPGAELRLATDIPDYAAHALEAVAAAPGFEVVAVRRTPPWPGWPGTRYEAKALAAGRRPQYLTFRRRSLPAGCTDWHRSAHALCIMRHLTKRR